MVLDLALYRLSKESGCNIGKHKNWLGKAVYTLLK